MPVSAARTILIERQVEDLITVGATANTFEDIIHADNEGASYVGLGPFRFTETKKKLSPVLGLEGYRRIMQQCKEAGLEIPVFAIGGIQLEDVQPLMETGITGIAVSGAIIGADDPVAETRRFVEEVNKYKTR
jgi:thiamine-phosphate pyrophosphorylase